MAKQSLSWFVVFGLCVTPALAQPFNSGSDGSDGPFNPQVDIEIDLGLAATGPWDMESPIEGQGVYDPAQWAVVFKYTTIDIPEDVTVTFKNHPKGAPVVWLAEGDITIDGMVILDGEDGWPTGSQGFAAPGPGGFEGGREGANTTTLQPSPGLGSGGSPSGGAASVSDGGGGGYGTMGTTGASGSSGPGGPTYGSGSILPLIGGSGGSSAANPIGGGGAGGGAILIATSGICILGDNAEVSANGGSGAASEGSAGSGGGSGGAIRVIADTVAGDGRLRALRGLGETANGTGGGGNGGFGRIRIEATKVLLTDGGNPAFTFSGDLGPVFEVDILPKLRIVSIAGVAVPQDPDAGITTRDMEVVGTGNVDVIIEAENIPPEVTVEVEIRPTRGSLVTATSSPLMDDGQGQLMATANMPLPVGQFEIQLRANWTP